MKIGTIVLLIVTIFILWQRFGPSTVDTSQLDFTQAVIIDVRSPGEFSGGHVDGALNLPIDTITEDALDKVTQKDQPIVLYCYSGGRASVVKNRMETWGFTNVHNLKTQSGVENALK